MAHTYPNALVHCIFSTKNRSNSIPDALRETLSMYFVGIGKGHDMPVLRAGGTANHAHLLIVLPATVSLAKAIQVLSKFLALAWRTRIRFRLPGRLRRVQRERVACRCSKALHRASRRAPCKAFL
jgi:REP element-mobilizing transposase RayT